MYIFKIVKSHDAVRCEVCHKADYYDTEKNFCSRCNCISTEEYSYRTINNISVNGHLKTYHICAKCRSTDVYPRSGICQRCGFIQELYEINTACTICNKSKRFYVSKKYCIRCSVNIFRHVANNLIGLAKTAFIIKSYNECTVCHINNISSTIGICQNCKRVALELIIPTTTILLAISLFIARGILLTIVAKMMVLFLLANIFLIPLVIMAIIVSKSIKQISQLFQNREKGINGVSSVEVVATTIIHSGALIFLGFIIWVLFKDIFLR